MQRQFQSKEKSHKTKNEQLNIESISCCNGKLFKIAETKKSLLVFFLTIIFLLIHVILHFQWFSTQHHFLLIYLFFFFKFVYIGSFLSICISDPGVVQKINYNFQIEKDLAQIPRNQHIKSHIKVSYLMKNKNMCGLTVLCPTCNVYPPQRSNHCKVCGFCVQKFDHHSQFLGTCIGKNNQKVYYLLICSMFFGYFVMAIMCIVMLSSSSNNFSKNQQIIPIAKSYPFSVILLVISIPVCILMAYKICFNFYLLANNLTQEQHKNKRWSNINCNPYSCQNYMTNLLNFIESTSQYRQLKLKYTKFVTSSKSSSDSEKKEKSISSCENKAQLSQQSMHEIKQDTKLQISPQQFKKQVVQRQLKKQLVQRQIKKQVVQRQIKRVAQRQFKRVDQNCKT